MYIQRIEEMTENVITMQNTIKSTKYTSIIKSTLKLK